VEPDAPPGRAARRASEDPARSPGRARPTAFVVRARRERARETAVAAARLLDEEGCFRFRVEDVAVAAGVAKGSVYLDHGGKASLVGGALGWACDEVLAELAALDVLPDPVARLRGAVRLLARLVRDRPELCVLLEGRLACATRWIGGDASPSEALARRLSAIVAGALRGAGLRRVDPRLATEVLLAAIGGPAGRRVRSWAALLRQLEALMPWLASPGGAGSGDGP